MSPLPPVTVATVDIHIGLHDHPLQQPLARDRQLHRPPPCVQGYQGRYQVDVVGGQAITMSSLGGGVCVPPLLVPLLSSALPAVIAITISGVIVVLVVAKLVVAAQRQYPGCRAIKPQVVGCCVAIPCMKIGRNVGTRRRSTNRTGGSGGRTASSPSAHPIATRSKNCTRSGSQWIKPPTSLTCCAAPGRAPMMTATTTEGGAGSRRCGARTTTRRRRINDGRVRCDSRGDPPHFGTTTTITTTMIRTMTRTSRAYVSSACKHATDATHKQFLLCNPTTVEGSDCFAKRTIRTKEGGEFNTMTTTTTTTTMTMMTPMPTTTTMTTATTTTTTGDAQQLHKVKKHVICLLFLNSPRATEAARRHTNPWNIDMIFMK